MTGDDRIESTPDRASASLNPQYSAINPATIDQSLQNSFAP
ncbi:hypothetical protein [Phormidesmis priestleyi]|nr:hypothetical protein [Phormidesmis priestleyi]